MSRLRVSLPRMDELVAEHPAFFKPLYYSMFVEPIRDALRAVGVAPEPAGRSERGVILRATFPDGRSVRAIVDYADQVHVDGLVPFARQEPSGDFNLVFKMKPCDRFEKEYDAYDRPVIPWGYVIAPTLSGEPEECMEDRKWFFEQLSTLRQIQDLTVATDPPPHPMMTRGTYHALGACPERRRLHDPELFQGEKQDRDFRQHMLDVARSGTLLNLCGPDNTIDRKVVEACAIGVPLVSNDGLKDLRLPWGRRFVHGVNVWFVDSVAAIKEAQSLPVETRRQLSAGGRDLYEACFAPASIGHWMLLKLWEHAR